MYVHAAHFCASTKNRVRHEVGRPNERVWNPKPPFSGEILHCQQYSLPLKKLLSVYLYVCGCICTEIYNVYHWGWTETCGHHRWADILAFFQIPSNHMLSIFILLYVYVEEFVFFEAEEEEGLFIGGHNQSLSIFSNILPLVPYSIWQSK